ncbi:MAG: GNAT family N-acetyltransferase [Candidatus Sumerlaeota bacterium]|nr:GNAT family N-acetyltransferase [Candidatus Sumerlaeota bacterium]
MNSGKELAHTPSEATRIAPASPASQGPARDAARKCGPAAGAPPPPIFLHPLWEKALREGLGQDVRILPLVGLSAGQPIGACIVHIGRKAFLRKASRPFATLFNAQWEGTPDSATRAAAIWRLLREGRFLALTLRECASVPRPSAETFLNYRQDLRDADRWSKYSEVARRSIRKATSAGTAMDRELHPAEFYRLFSACQIACKRVPLPFSERQFATFADMLAESSRLETFFARDAAGRVTAAHAVLLDHPVAYDALSARDPEIRSTRDNYFLVHEIMSYFSRQGYSAFDHCGANIASVREFKRRFAPREVVLSTETHGILGVARRLTRKWFYG